MRNHARMGLLLAGLLSACGGDGVKTPVTPSSPPIALEDALLYTTGESGADHAQSLLVDLTGSAARVTRSELPAGAAKLFARNGHEGEALILTAGEPARLEDGEARDAVPSYVLLFDRSGEIKRFELSASYAALTVSDDGHYAIAHEPGGAWSTADSIAVIDLERASPSQPVETTMVRALDGKGPSAVAFAPADAPRRLAVLVMSDAINVLDLEHPERKDKVLPLKLPNGTGGLRARKVLFAGDHCFVQADSGADIFAVRFEDAASGFRASLSTLATENVVEDLALLSARADGAQQRLLALGARTLRLIDTNTGKGESTATNAAFKAAALFESASPFDDAQRPRALLYAKDVAQIGFADLQAELPGSERSVDVLSLSAPVAQLELVAAQGLAIALLTDGKVSLIDLAERTVSALSTGGAPKALVLDQRAGVERAWVLTAAGTLGSIQLTSRDASEILLTRAADFVLPLSGARARLVVGHRSSSGALTLLDATEPARSTAREVFGFLFSNYLD